jgi:clan AA aspartic protease
MHIYCEVELKGMKAVKKVRMFVDTGATRTVIPHKLASEIGSLASGMKAKVKYADGDTREVDTANVIIKVLDRETPELILLDDVEEPILGVYTLEALGLKVDPKEGKIEPSRNWTIRL